MKVAFIVTQFPAISETFILRQITGLLERGHLVDIFAHIPGHDRIQHPEIEKYGLLNRTSYLTACACADPVAVRLIKRIRLLLTSFHKHPQLVLRTLNLAAFGKPALFLQILCQVAPFFNKGPYDVIHCQFGSLGQLGLLLRDTGTVRGKIITSFRGYDISSYVAEQGENIYEDLFRRGDLFLCVSDHIKGKLIRLGCNAKKIIVHRSGIDPTKFSVLEREAKSGKLTILTIARLVEKKGVEYGIAAVGRVLKRYPLLDYKVVGEGPMRDKLRNLIAELNLTDAVELLGSSSEDQVAELLRKADILLAPSSTSSTGDEEGIPGVIMEAFAAGLPVVSTNHAGIPELVKNGDSGFLVAEKDVDALARKLEILIEHPGLRHRMGQAGRKFVDEYHNIDTLNNRLVDIYQQLIQGKEYH